MEQDEAWLSEGTALFNAGDLAEAESVLRQVGVSSPLCRDALLQLSRVLLASGQAIEALRCAEEADNLGREADSCLQWGACLMGQDLAAAKRMFGMALDLDPGLVDAYLMLGHVERAAGQPQAAIRAYDEAIRIDDAHLAARYYLAEVLLEQREITRASAQLHYLLKLRPDYGPGIILVGDIAFFHEDYRQAVVEYVRAHELNENGAAMLVRLGQAFEKLRDPFQACKAYDRALRVDRKHWDSHLAAGRLCEQQLWFNRAHRYYEALAFVQTHRTEAYKGLARVEAGVQQSGLDGIDPAGAPEDNFEYLEGRFSVPEVLATPAAQNIALAPSRPTNSPAQAGERADRDAYGVGSEAAGYLADFVAEPKAQPRAIPPKKSTAPFPRAPGSGMLETLQQKLKQKLSENAPEPPGA